MRTVHSERPPPQADDRAPLSAREWWGQRQWPYNRALLAAGFLAFLCYVIALEVRCADSTDVEVTVFTILFQGVGYLLAMGLANVCYQLGAGAERLVPHDARGSYRRWAFRAGLGFSVALPFLVPAAVLVLGC
jgi:hypothetical protein